MKKLIFVIVLLALPLVCFGQEGTFKPGSEPDGFRGIKWGTDIKDFTDMKRISTGSKRYFKATAYIKENDDLIIEGIEFKKIRYGFLEGKEFNSVDAFTKSEMNLQDWNNFKNIFIEKHGENYLREDNLSDEIYTWKGEVSTITIRFSKAYKSFSLTIQHKFPDTSDMQPQVTVSWEPCDLDFDGKCDDYDKKLFQMYLGGSDDGDNYCSPCDADHNGIITEADRKILFPSETNK